MMGYFSSVFARSGFGWLKVPAMQIKSGDKFKLVEEVDSGATYIATQDATLGNYKSGKAEIHYTVVDSND